MKRSFVAEPERFIYRPETRDLAHVYRRGIGPENKPTPLFLRSIEFRALYTAAVKEFLKGRHGSRAATIVFAPLFAQLTRAVESVGRNCADAYGLGDTRKSIQSHRCAYGSILESLFFLSCLPPPFSTTLHRKLSTLRNEYKGMFTAVLERHLREVTPRSKDLRASNHSFREMLVRLGHETPPLYFVCRDFSRHVIEAAIVFVERDASKEELDVDGPIVSKCVEDSTCIAANIIEGYGVVGLGKNIGFLFTARRGLWKFVAESSLLPPPFSTTLHDKALELAPCIDELVETATTSIIKGFICPL